MAEKKVIIIQAAPPAKPSMLRVAAYARVSLETERLTHSLAAQISYFSDLIQKTPGWQYAGVYADEFVTGTSIEKRTEFQRLIEDCEAGLIDIVLVKSISRFARNTVDLLREISAIVMGDDEFSEDHFSNQIDCIRVYNDGRLAYHFKDGSVTVWDGKEARPQPHT